MPYPLPFYSIGPSLLPNDDIFADATLTLESFEKYNDANRCQRCGRLLDKRVRASELVIEWIVDQYQKGTDVIADWYFFSWRTMISDRVLSCLKSNRFSGYALQPVRMTQDPKLHRPKRVTSKTKIRIWLPYEGPPLHELVVTGRVEVNLERNHIEVTEHLKCSSCNHLIKALGFPFPRVPLSLDSSDWGGNDIFRLDYKGVESEDNASLYCVTESMRQALVDARFTNIEFSLMGYIHEH